MTFYIDIFIQNLLYGIRAGTGTDSGCGDFGYEIAEAKGFCCWDSDKEKES